MRFRPSGASTALVLFAWSVTAGATALLAQQRWWNSPQPDTGRQVIPFFEGWYANDDGTYTLSFGYLNRNPEQVIEIPLGELNYMEPARFDGVQPSTFHGSRDRGTFAVTIPADMRDEDVWWYLTDERDGQTYKVPGRTSAAAYQLDWMPRPHGSLPPWVWLDSESEAARGPGGIWADEALTTSVGEPVTLSINVRDPSERDPDDPRFAETIPVRVVWLTYRGSPEDVTFTRHPSHPAPETEGGDSGPGPEVVILEDAEGTARVNATFHEAGEYVIMARADNWGSPDSSAGDQCCWTNAYIPVEVTP